VKAKDLHDLYSAAPFQPFEIVLTNGACVLVDHPEFMSFSPDHRTVHVFDRDGTGKRIDVKMVIALNELNGSSNGARSRKRKRKQ
jgi:hypothetical protein